MTWLLIDMGLPKFDIYQDTGAPIKKKKKALRDVRSEIRFVRRNIVSTRQSMRA